MSDSLLHPTAKNIRSIYVALHEQFEPYLLGDMVRRSPGKGASSDGTFRLILRTRTDGKVLAPLLGKVVAHCCALLVRSARTV